MSIINIPHCRIELIRYYLLIKKRDRGELELEKEIEEYEEKEIKMMNRRNKEKKSVSGTSDIVEKKQMTRDRSKKDLSVESKNSYNINFESSSNKSAKSKNKLETKLTLFPRKAAPPNLEIEEIDIPMPSHNIAKSLHTQNKKSIVIGMHKASSKSRSNKKNSNRLYGVKMYVEPI